MKNLSWEDVDLLVNKLADKILKNYKPNLIIALLRGGVIVGRILSDKLKVKDMLVIGIKSYKDVGVKGDLIVYQWFNESLVLGKKVLLVDDICDSGETLSFCFEKLSKLSLEDIKTATLHVKPWSKFKPNFYMEEVKEWVIYPWEREEFK